MSVQVIPVNVLRLPVSATDDMHIVLPRAVVCGISPGLCGPVMSRNGQGSRLNCASEDEHRPENERIACYAHQLNLVKAVRPDIELEAFGPESKL